MRPLTSPQPPPPTAGLSNAEGTETSGRLLPLDADLQLADADRRRVDAVLDGTGCDVLTV